MRAGVVRLSRLAAVGNWLARGIERSIAILIAVHGGTVLLLGDAAWRGFWFGLAALPAPVEGACEILLALSWIVPRLRPWRFVMAAVALVDGLRVFDLILRGSIRTPLPLPMSLGLVALLVYSASRPAPKGSRLAGAAGIAAGLAAVPLLWILSFGLTDYRSGADAAVVFGAKAYADGSPSLALYDRTTAGIDLHRAGLAPTLVFTGGPGEPEAMRRLALDAGVPDSALVLDDAGLNTRESAARIAAMAREHGWRRVLVVSHYYHLPRIKMACLQEGVDVRTVPCRMSRRLLREPYFLARECAGFYAYMTGLDRLRE